MAVLPGGLRQAGGVGVNPPGSVPAGPEPWNGRTGHDTDGLPELQAVEPDFSAASEAPTGEQCSRVWPHGFERDEAQGPQAPAQGGHAGRARLRGPRTERRDVAGNFGVQGKGWIFWTALVMIFALGIAGVVTLALL